MLDIELKGISKTYPGSTEPAVKELCLGVEKGSIISLLGPSGCGKTTTLRLIAGFERHERGSITLAGKTVSGDGVWIPPEKRGIGMVFQDYALFPHLNVNDNIGFGYKAKDKKNRVLEVLELVNLKGYENRYPHELSGGQQQRVALARALAKRPVVILLDEPFSNLDADLREYMRLEMKRIIKETGTTGVFVTHDQKDALAISDRIVVMKDGVVQQTGTPREIYQYPENKFVATFVGQSNILEGVMNDDGKSVITELGIIPCNHTHGIAPGNKVFISIRPESLEQDQNGPISGIIISQTYTGQNIDAVLEVDIGTGSKTKLLVHVHPEVVVKEGQRVNFKVLANFVAVIKHG